MDHPTGIGDLTPEEWDKLQGILDRFELACRDGRLADLGRFLPPPGHRLHFVSLRELVKADLEVRWRNGQNPLLEEYTRRYPDLTRDSVVLADLLYEEYRVRQRHGDRPTLTDFATRFPEQFAELQRRVHEQAPATPPPPAEETPQGGTIRPGAARPPSAGGLQLQIGGSLPIEGDYQLLRRLGSGSFGEVWRAEAPGGVEVAIKVIFRPLDHAEAKRELEALELVKRLRHPFLLQTQAFWSLEDRLLIAMELADGSLRDRLKECHDAGLPGIPPDELLRYCTEAGEALDFLHRQQVLHRDIKPDNILILAGHAKLGDLGLARVLQTQRSFTATGCGTPAYMAPEVWRGRISPHSDQYSLAATYAELRLHRRLFPGSDMMQLMLAHVEGAPDLESLPLAERQVLLKALAKEAEERYPDCRSFCLALQRAWTGAAGADGLPAPVLAEAAPPRPAVPRRPGAKRTARRIAATLLVLLAGAVLAGALIWGPKLFSPTEEKLHLPPGCVAEEGVEVVVQDGRRLGARIAYQLADGDRVEFLLIPPSRSSDPPAFYIMQDKVSNRFFRRFAAANTAAVKNSEWEKGAERDDGSDVGNADDLPVLRVTAVEADQFARWLGGKLPTARQWDKAAGRFDGAAGPFIGDSNDWQPGDFALRRRNDGPLPVGKAARDRSRFGCRDMASNGREWTRTAADGDVEVRFGPGDDAQEVRLRGCSYREVTPFKFDHPADRDFFDLAKPDIGFRVVLELPAP